MLHSWVACFMLAIDTLLICKEKLNWKCNFVKQVGILRSLRLSAHPHWFLWMLLVLNDSGVYQHVFFLHWNDMITVNFSCHWFNILAVHLACANVDVIVPILIWFCFHPPGTGVMVGDSMLKKTLWMWPQILHNWLIHINSNMNHSNLKWKILECYWAYEKITFLWLKKIQF